MSWKSITCVAVMCALMASQALADPIIDVVGRPNGGNTDWTVSFTPDPSLLAGGEGSMAIEFSFEVTADLIGMPTIDPSWMETHEGTLILNPGNNPYEGDVTDGVEVHENVASQLGGGGNVNALFASLGSTLFEEDGPKTAFSFTTAGVEGVTVDFGGFVAQDEDAGAEGFFHFSGTAVQTLFDANVDGAVNNLDIDDMVLALINQDDWKAAHPGLNILHYLDGDGSGVVDNLDIDSYVDALIDPPYLVLAGGATAVPEPSTLVTLGIAGTVCVFARRRLRKK